MHVLIRSILVIFCLLVIEVKAQSNSFDNLREFSTAVLNNDLVRAASIAKRLLNEPSQFKNVLDEKETLELQFQLAAALARNGEVQLAINALDAALDNSSGQGRSWSLNHVPYLARLSQMFVDLENYKSAGIAVKDAIDVLQSFVGAEHPRIRWLLVQQAEIIAKNGARNQERCGDRTIQFDPDSASCQREHNFSPTPYSVGIEKSVERRIKHLERMVPTNILQPPIPPHKPNAKSLDSFQIVPVFYGTNRERTKLRDPSTFYGSRRSRIRFGVVSVSVPKIREIGSIPEPTIWRLEFRPDPKKHIYLEDISEYRSMEEFKDKLTQRLEASTRKEIFLFVHGYNNNFSDAAKRTAQLAVDLEIDGAAVLYSWPSRGGPFSYVADTAQLIQPMVKDLRRFLEILAGSKNALRVHLVAHSMGSRYLLAALEDFIKSDKENRPNFDEVVFASPDIDAEDFASRLPTVKDIAKRYTLYAARDDHALWLSRRLNGDYRRAGDATTPLILPQLDTIDITAETQSSLGHDDLFGPAIDDFRAIIWHSLVPMHRCILESKLVLTGSYWALVGANNSACNSSDFKQAIMLRRRMNLKKAKEWLQDQVKTAQPSEHRRLSRIEKLVEMLP